MINLLKPTGYVMHHQFNIQQLYALPTLYLCVLYLSDNKQQLVPRTDWVFKHSSLCFFKMLYQEMNQAGTSKYTPETEGGGREVWIDNKPKQNKIHETLKNTNP